jgi:SAM-dependent methyltransferase
MDVSSADVSEEFLNMINTKYKNYKNKPKTILLNGENLSNIKSNSYDIVATYSVLHHIPEYLQIISEFYRILKKGGIMYLDHEVNENFWNRSKDYTIFLKKAKIPYIISNYKNYISFDTIKTRLIQIKNPRYRPEGDIHVFKDDHIEWKKIEKVIKKLGGEIKLEEDYLLYKKGYPKKLYNQYKNKCSDYKLMLIKKNV